MVAVPLIHGRLTAADYEDDVAADPRIDRAARQDGMRRGHSSSARDYLDPDKRSIANAITGLVQGRHARRRRSSSNIRSAIAAGAQEGIPVLDRQVQDQSRAPLRRSKQQQAILDVRARSGRGSPAHGLSHEFVDLMVQ